MPACESVEYIVQVREMNDLFFVRLVTVEGDVVLAADGYESEARPSMQLRN
jgi:hypothetical protein